MNPEKLELIRTVLPMIGVMMIVPIAGWVITTWMRIKHGYPLDGQWGQALHPKRDAVAEQKIAALTEENAALRDDLSAITKRLAVVESIVTDDGLRLSKEIDGLALVRN